MKKYMLVLCAIMCIVLSGCGSNSLSDKGEETDTPTATIAPNEAASPKEKEQESPEKGEDEMIPADQLHQELIMEKDSYTAEKLYQISYTAITKPVSREMTSYYSIMEETSSFSHSSRIPQELSQFILEAMKLSMEEKSFSPLKEGAEINQEEFCSLTGHELENFETVYSFMGDIDNDGIQDLIGQIYGGGTGGFSTMVLYRGSEVGEYTLTNSFECLLQNYVILHYQGKNYLLMEEFNYNTKYYSGYTLYLYEEGILADGMDFYFEIEDYDKRVEYEKQSFPGMDLIRNALGDKGLPELLDNNDGVLIGSAELIEEENSSIQYSCDIDNDGIAEKYNKYMWYPSNMGTVMMCMYVFDDSTVLDEVQESLVDEVGEGRLYAFWLDRIDGKNIMYLYYGENLDFTLYAVLIS